MRTPDDILGLDEIEKIDEKIRERQALQAVDPPHYRHGDYETWDVIEAWQACVPPEIRYHWGSALKYLSRLGAKEGAPVAQDIEKAIAFLTRALKVLK